MSRYFLDTEFIDDGRTIDLISLAIVGSDGSELYLCNQECELNRATPWLQKNVLPHLPPRSSPRWVSRSKIASEVLWTLRGTKRPEIWAYYAAYDWVAFCQLFGRMVDLPSFLPRHCLDLKQWATMLDGLELPQQEGTKHDALEDARWAREVHGHLSHLCQPLSVAQARADGLLAWLERSDAAEAFRLGRPHLEWSLERMFEKQTGTMTRSDWRRAARSYVETTRYMLDRPERYPAEAGLLREMVNDR